MEDDLSKCTRVVGSGEGRQHRVTTQAFMVGSAGECCPEANARFGRSAAAYSGLHAFTKELPHGKKSVAGKAILSDVAQRLTIQPLPTLETIIRIVNRGRGRQ